MKETKYDKIITEMYSPENKEFMRWDVKQVSKEKFEIMHNNVCTLK